MKLALAIIGLLAALGVGWLIVSDEQEGAGLAGEETASADSSTPKPGESRLNAQGFQVANQSAGDAPKIVQADSTSKPGAAKAQAEPARNLAIVLADLEKALKSGKFKAQRRLQQELRSVDAVQESPEVLEILLHNTSWGLRALVLEAFHQPDPALINTLVAAQGHRFDSATKRASGESAYLGWLVEWAVFTAAKDAQPHLLRLMSDCGDAELRKRLASAFEKYDACKGPYHQRAFELLVQGKHDALFARAWASNANLAQVVELIEASAKPSIRDALLQDFVNDERRYDEPKLTERVSGMVARLLDESFQAELFGVYLQTDKEAAFAFARTQLADASLTRRDFEALASVLAGRGHTQDRQTLEAMAFGRDSRSAIAASALMKHDVSFASRVFEESQSVVARAEAAKLLMQEDAPRWREKVLAPHQPGGVRLAGLNALDTARDRETLKRVGESDTQASMRSAAIKRLGALKDTSLKPWFESIGQNDSQPSIRTLARGFAKALDKERTR